MRTSEHTGQQDPPFQNANVMKRRFLPSKQRLSNRLFLDDDDRIQSARPYPTYQ